MPGFQIPIIWVPRPAREAVLKAAPDSAIGNGLAAQRSADPVTVCRGHGVSLMTVTGQIDGLFRELCGR
jgi:hypothetical protein